MEKLGDMKISGIGKMNGGRFKHVKIEGMGKIFGDVEAESAKIEGSSRIEGNVKIKDLSAEGNCTINGAVESDRIKNSGNIKIGGPIKANRVSNSGRLVSNGAIKAERIDSEGYLKVNGDMEAEEFICDGAFKVEGLLNANHIDIKIKWASSAKEIGGDKIRVRNSSWNSINQFILSMIGKSNIVETELIEGTEIHLENTKAGTVRGNNIKIGPKCDIDLIEYSGTLEIDPESVVRKQTKI